MNKKKIAAGFAALVFALPALALAQSASTSVGVSAGVQTQIASLLSQIQALQQQLKSLLASTTAPVMSEVESLVGSTTPPFMGRHGDHGSVPCVLLNRNLSIGSEGDDVRQLQEVLAQNPEDGFTASSTGYFGPLTEHAMMRYQIQMGIASSSGFVGPLTRAFFKDRCGLPAQTGGSDQGVGNGGMDNGMHGGLMIRVVNGSVSANNGSSITVQDRASDTTVTVNITASTTIMINSTSSAPSVGSSADLTTGTDVMVQGHNNADGSVDAMRITIGVLPTPPLPVDGQAGGEGEMGIHMGGDMHASPTQGGPLNGLMQFFNPFLPHSDN